MADSRIAAMLAVDFLWMADLAQFDLKTRGREARIRALLEDLIQAHIGGRPQAHLALAVWFQKSPESDGQYLLELLSEFPIEGITGDHLSLLWKTGSQGPPYANVSWASVDYFWKLSSAYPDQVAQYRDRYEVLYFDKRLLTPQILEMFRIVTEPPGLIRGWYIPETEYAKSNSIQNLLSLWGHTRPNFGLVKIEESGDFENCRGILHVEVTQKWLPLSPEGIRPYTYYTDLQSGRPVYFLFEGGSLYQVLKFEVKTAPEYPDRLRLLGKTPHDRYPEVYLRAVHPPAQPAA